MTGAAIRAANAFVEFFVKEETIDPALRRIKAKMQSLGAVIDSVGERTSTAMTASATPAVVTTGVQVGALTTSFFGARVAALAIGRTVTGVFAKITGSVTAATASLGAMAFAVKTFGKGTKVEGVLDGFLSKSQTVEAAGRWTRFFGAITGSHVLKDMGNRVERMGMGASVINGLQKSGLSGGLSAWLGAGFRSVRGMAVRGTASLITSPFRLAFGGARAVVASVIPQLDGVKNSADGSTTSMRRTAGAARLLSGGSFNLGKALGGVSLKLGAISAAILGPTLTAAKSFVSSAQEMTKESEKTGTSLEDLIALKYGSNSLISPSDIQAAAKLAKVMDVLKKTVSAAWAQIGVAALPTLTRMTQSSLEWANIIVRMIRDNREWIATGIRLASIVGTIAAGFGIASVVLMALGTAASVVLNPITLIAGGIAALAYAFPELRKQAVGTFGYLFGNFGQLAAIVQDTMQAVQDSLMGGNVQMAARVLWTGLKLAWMEGAEELHDLWRRFTNSIAGVSLSAFAQLQKIWIETTRLVTDEWAMAMNFVQSQWKATQNWFAKSFATVIAKVSGQKADEVLATLNEMQQQDATASTAEFHKGLLDREAAAKKATGDIDQDDKDTQLSLSDELKGQRAAAQTAINELRKQFAEQIAAAAKLRPDQKDRIEAPAKAKKAESERQQQPISSADIRSQEGLTEVIKSLFGGDKAAETAKNTAKTAELTATGNKKLEDIYREIGRQYRSNSDVMSLRNARTTTT